MEINLEIVGKDLNEGKWVKYHDDIEFKIRHLNDHKINKFSKKHTKQKWKAGQYYPDPDNDAAADEMFDYALEDWKGFTDKDSNIVECNEKNKKSFRKNYYSQLPPGAHESKVQKYGEFIVGYSRDINNYTDVKAEEAEQKNL